MKKTLSILLSLIMLLSITAGVDLSAYAGTSAKELGIVSSSNFDPTGSGYIIDNQSNQFDFFENYKSIEELNNLIAKEYGFTTNDKIYDIYSQKLGIASSGLNEYQKIAKIYYFVEKTIIGTSEIVSSEPLFISRRGHCQAYANVFIELCKRANIECWTISSARHEWNIVKLNGKYYQCDAMGDIFLASMQDAINGYANQWMEIMNYDGSEHYSGNNALTQWKNKHNSISTSDYSLPTETTGLAMPKTTTTATSEGVVVKWDPVADADWYEVYYANVDGITNNASLTKSDPVTWEKTTTNFNNGDYVYFKYGTSSLDSQGNISFKTAGDTTTTNSNVVHSIDKNEKGQYQFFISPDKLTTYGVVVVVVAKNVNGKVSVSDRDPVAMANAIGETPNSKNVVSIDKNTGATVKSTAILKVTPGNYATNNSYNSNSHNINTKVATIIKATSNAQGAEVYECPNCLQRKMVYTKATGSGSTENTTKPHTHTWDNGKVTKVATCSAAGVKTFTCTSCGATKTEAIAYPKTITLSISSYVYNGSERKPGVTIKDSAGQTIAASNYTVTYSNNKNVGTATVKVTFKGNYSGTISKTFKIIPKNTSISSVTAQYKGFTVKLKKYTTQTTGYQIQYSTSSSFSSSKTVTISNTTTSKTVTGLTAKKKYYVRIRTYRTVGSTKYYSAWSSAKTVTTSSYPTTITLSASSYTYNGKVKKPTVTVKNNGTKISSKYYTVSYSSGRKNVGTYTVTIKFKAPYSGTVKKTFTIKPKATTLSSVSAKSKGFTVKWKKLTTQTTGYQIQYSTSSKFTNAKTVTVSKNSTTSKTITGLTAKKKYYVRVRTYKTVKVNGKSTKIYSSWSKAKTVTTK